MRNTRSRLRPCQHTIKIRLITVGGAALTEPMRLMTHHAVVARYSDTIILV